MNKTTEWLDNPFRTIIEFCEMEAFKNKTVIESLNKLKEMLGNTDNKLAGVRIQKAINFVVSKFSSEILNDRDNVTQGGIIVIMKMKLKE